MTLSQPANVAGSVDERVHQLNEMPHLVAPGSIIELQRKKILEKHFSLRRGCYSHPWKIQRVRVFVEPDALRGRGEGFELNPGLSQLMGGVSLDGKIPRFITREKQHPAHLLNNAKLEKVRDSLR